jgi:hypothetical protein
MTRTAHSRMYRFTVVGGTSFPIDMLRYDDCWPASERDAGLIERMIRHEHKGIEEVALRGLCHPTEARWESFMWQVKPGSVVEI